MDRIQLEGKRFGRLTVQHQAPSIGIATAYECRCDCGNRKIVRGVSLRKGETTSCGCFRSERMAKEKTTHGMYGSPTYNSWRAMLMRCNDKSHKQFNDYGGRGISVCIEWHLFENFFADMGERPPDRTLDRCDVNKNYEPGNCRWATRQEQNSNRRKPLRGNQNVQ